MAGVLSPSVPASVIEQSPVTAGDAVPRASKLLADGHLEAARALLREAISSNPRDDRAYVLLARSYLASEPQRARRVAIALLRRGVRSVDTLNMLTASYEKVRSKGLSVEQEQAFRNDEIKDLGQVLDRHPDWPEPLYRRGSQHLALERLLPRGDRGARDRELADARRDLERVLSMLADGDPVRVRSSAHHQLGRAYAAQAQVRSDAGGDARVVQRLRRAAAKQFSRALSLDPERVDAAGELVLVHLAGGQPKSAAKAIREALGISRKPKAEAKLHSMLGNLYADGGRWRDAVASLERALLLEPRTPDAYIGLLKAHRGLADAAAADAALERGLAAMPGLLIAHLELGKLDVARGDYAAAAAHFLALMRVAPVDSVVVGTRPSRNVHRNRLYHNAASWLAWLLVAKQDRPAEALKAVTFALRFGPLDPALADTRGLALHKLGRHREAREVLARTAREAGDFPAVHLHLAQTLAALGDRKSALAAVERALAFEQDFEERDAAKALRDRLRAR